MSELTLYRGEVFDFIDSPLNRKDAYRYFPDGALVVREGEIVDCGPFEEIKGRYTDYELVDYSGKLLMPGFIDSHIHYPQAEIIGMYGRQLLDWLGGYTLSTQQGQDSRTIPFQQNRRLFLQSMRIGWPTSL